MKSFLKFYLASLVAGLTFFFIGFIMIMALGLSGANSGKEIADGSTLRIRFSGAMQDYVPRSDFPSIDELLGGNATLSMEKIVFNILKAKDDDRIESILLDLGTFTAGTAQLREIRNALEAFKSEGKTVYAYGMIISQSGYYLGSVADSIFLSSTGAMEFSGLSSNVPYLKGAFEKLGVEINLIRGSDNVFKSAGEPLISESMSDYNRLQISSYLNDIWSHILEDIASDGRLSVDQLNLIADNGVIIKPETALEWGMVDGLLFEDELLSKFGEHDNYSFVSLNKYSKESVGKSADFQNRIAVVYAEGDVSLGKSSPGTMGSETIVEALRDARTNDRIKAVVLRVNSPGGVSLAGDAMWREMQLVREVKPLIVSMGNVAASAGYQISAPADTILVQPQTITGSIGVFMLYPNASGLLNDHLGINLESVGTNAMSDFGTLDRPLTESEYLVLQKNVDAFYSHFKEQVAEGRGLDMAHVDTIARGRVWTGAQALELGLADMEGGLVDAIEIAKEMAGLDGNPRISSYPIPIDPVQEWLNSMNTQSTESQIREQLGPVAPAYDVWKRLKPMMGTQKRMLEYSMEDPL